jgi:endonuclease-8
MPEGDTVFVTCRRLHSALAGRPVTRFQLRVPQLALADLTGASVVEVVPRGKHIMMRFSTDQTLHSHLRLDGSWRVGHAAARPRGRDHEIRALVGNQEWLAAGFRLYDIKLVPTAEENQLVGHLGPDLLSADFDAAEALRRFVAQPDRQIAEALLDQRLVAGIGNVYKSELLFLHRVSPYARVAEVEELPAILTDAQRLLAGNLRDFSRSTTGWHQPGQQYWVYGRGGKACLRCRSAIQRDAGPGVAAGVPEDRVTYYCPSCQRVTRPAGDT